MPVFMTPSSKPASGHVIVSLHVESAPPGFQYPLRRIALSTGDRLRIGRASKVESKGFVAAENNGWFDTPVMSRQHAEITIDSEKVINITDTGSLHGTFVNGAIVRKDTCHELVHGDEVNFGVEIYRATESYPPAKIRVGIQHLDEMRTNGSVNTFRAPDIIIDDEDDGSSSDHDCVQVSHARAFIPDNDRPPTRGRAETDDLADATVIDLTETSPRGSPSPVAGRGPWASPSVTVHDAWAAVVSEETAPPPSPTPSSLMSVRRGVASPPPDGAMCGEATDDVASANDDESIHLSSDSDDDLPADIDDDLSSDEGIYNSADDIDADADDDDIDADADDMDDSGGLESELENLSDLQDTEDEYTSDEEPQTTTMAAHTLALIDDDSTEEVHTAQTIPTSSKSHGIHISTLLNPAESTFSRETPAGTATEALGTKSGKLEFFAAREHNKALMTQKAAGELAPLIHPTGLPLYADAAPVWQARPSNPEHPDEKRPGVTVVPPIQARSGATTVEDEAVDRLNNSALLQAGDKFLFSPDATISFDVPTYLDDEEALVSAAVFQEHKLAAAAATSGQDEQKKCGLKRKAEDMSRADETVETANGPAKPADKAPEPVGPPAKRAKMSTTKSLARAVAEKIALAAIGGVMVFGSLVISAPQLA